VRRPSIEPEGTSLKAALDVARKYRAVRDRDLPLADYASAGCDLGSCPRLFHGNVTLLVGHLTRRDRRLGQLLGLLVVASLSDSLWDQNRDLAEAALGHQFVRGIASGDLARATFAYYVGQDAVFLDAFCRAYGLGLAKSPDREGLISFRELLDAAVDELRLHTGYTARWGVDLHQAAGPATSAYTDFLLAIAALEPVGHIAAAMTPCMRLYAYLAQQVAAHTKPESPYREWVETYSSAEFEAQARRLEDLLDRYGGDHNRLAVLYHRAMELELRFFDAAIRGETP
jgi:thiaminase (transcriptional activator TenA)